MEQNIILVDKNGVEIGVGEKMSVHRNGLLHRAFSIFIFKPTGLYPKNNELLIQKRSKKKYHSAGLWSNTCCSHPMPGESVIDAAHRRLKEEMGFDCPLKEVFTFSYKIKFPNVEGGAFTEGGTLGLTENEYDHILVGQYDGKISADSDEVEDYKFVSRNFLIKDLEENRELYTYWFYEILCRCRNSGWGPSFGRSNASNR
jgi:isopentenyl-diphosphate delta-isomerase